MEKVSPISAVDSYYSKEEGKFIMIMGDESGMIKIQDLMPIIEQYNLEEEDVLSGDNKLKRNAHRIIPLEDKEKNLHDNNDKDSDAGSDKKIDIKMEPETTLKGGDIQCINSF